MSVLLKKTRRDFVLSLWSRRLRLSILVISLLVTYLQFSDTERVKNLGTMIGSNHDMIVHHLRLNSFSAYYVKSTPPMLIVGDGTIREREFDLLAERIGTKLKNISHVIFMKKESEQYQFARLLKSMGKNIFVSGKDSKATPQEASWSSKISKLTSKNVDFYPATIFVKNPFLISSLTDLEVEVIPATHDTSLYVILGTSGAFIGNAIQRLQNDTPCSKHADREHYKLLEQLLMKQVNVFFDGDGRKFSAHDVEQFVERSKCST